MSTMTEAKDAARMLVEDLNMLLDGTWTPDKHSIQASIDNATVVAGFFDTGDKFEDWKNAVANNETTDSFEMFKKHYRTYMR